MGPPNVFPKQVEQMYLIDIPKKDQDKFVDILHKKIDNNKKLKVKLENLRNKIDETITKAFNNL